MPEHQLPIFSGQLSDNTADWRDALPVNVQHVAKPILGATGYLRSAPGLVAAGTGQGPDRGGIYNANQQKHFRLSGRNLIEYNTDGTHMMRGEILGNDQAVFLYSFQSTLVISGRNVYRMPNSGTLTRIDDPDLGQILDGVWIDGYFIFADTRSNLVQTEILDETSIDVTNYGSSEIDPDPILGVGVLYNRLLAFNENSIEFYFNAGNPALDFQFTRIPEQTIPIGIVGTRAKVRGSDIDGNQYYYILGGGDNEPVTFRITAQGTAPRIATREIDEILATYTADELSACLMETRRELDHDFMIAHLARHTLIYDLATSKAVGQPAWTIHRQAENMPTTWVNGVFDPRLNAWIYGDKDTNRIGRLDHSIDTHYGDNVEQIFYTPAVPVEGRRIQNLTIIPLPGRAPIGRDPVLFVEASQDGLLFSHPREMAIGTRGRYRDRYNLRKLGYFKNWVMFRFRKFNDTPVSFAKLMIRVE